MQGRKRIVSDSPAFKPTSHHRTPSSKNNKQSSSSSSLGVYLRLRPLEFEEATITRIDAQQVRTIPPDGSDPKIYSFTQVFERAQQSEIFEQIARPVAEEVVTRSKDGLIFTYGVTGSGKTYTMEGRKSDPGLIYRTMDFLFNSIGSHQTPRSLIVNNRRPNSYRLGDNYLYPDLERAETPLVFSPSETKFCQNRAKEMASATVDPTAYFCVFITLVDLYGKNVYDLFERDDEKRGKKIFTDEDGVPYVEKVTEHEVKSADEAIVYYMRGIQRRKTGSTALNENSSRGHCVLNLKLVQVRKLPYSDKFDQHSLDTSQLCLVDLAGSERSKDSRVVGKARNETNDINNSLTALGKCIRELRDREPTDKTQNSYRGCNLTRLFKTYFDGHGSVRMVLCVKPNVANFNENKIAMEFGLLTQDVAVDYASPPKRSKSRSQDYEVHSDMIKEILNRKKSMFEPSPEWTDDEFISKWIERLKKNRDRRKKIIEIAHGAKTEVRERILRTEEDYKSLKQLYEDRVQDLRLNEKEVGLLKSDINTTERSREKLVFKLKSLEREYRELKSKEKDARKAAMESDARLVQQKENYIELLKRFKDEKTRNHRETIKMVDQLLKRAPNEWTTLAPSAPLEHMQSSSPIDIPNNQSTSEETTESHTPPTTTNSSSPVMEYQNDHRISTSPVKTVTSPFLRGRAPAANPRHNRSLSTPSIWVHHKPKGTIDTGTVMKPKYKNGPIVKNLRSSDLLRKDAGSYSVTHQDADQNGDVVTTIHKAKIIPTVCGGAQVHFIDDETEVMTQLSPKRQRAASDAHFTH